MLNIESRRKITKEIRLVLIKELGDNIVSATVYGSTLSAEYCIFSDFDILLVLKSVSQCHLTKLRYVRDIFQKRNIDIDFNTHGYDEIPKLRKETFWHNNRALYMQKELTLYGKQLIGENLFNSEIVDTRELRLEVVRIISSLNYQARKLLVNKKLNRRNKILMMKWCIYAVMYYLAFYDIYPIAIKSALQLFNEKFKPVADPSIFLEIKIGNKGMISTSRVMEAYSFLTSLESRVLQEYWTIYPR